MRRGEAVHVRLVATCEVYHLKIYPRKTPPLLLCQVFSRRAIPPASQDESGAMQSGPYWRGKAILITRRGLVHDARFIPGGRWEGQWDEGGQITIHSCYEKLDASDEGITNPCDVVFDG